MEEDGFLNCLKEEHLFALHYIYIPRIQKSLDEFKCQWNGHPVSTAENLSPEQLFIRGTMSNCNRNILEGMNGSDEFDAFGSGIDSDAGGSLPINDDDYGVSVPQMTVNDQLSIMLQENINPLSDDGYYGVNLFRACVQLSENTTGE
jgi:hypothetical protein